MISIIVFLRNQMMNVRKTKKERYDILNIKLTSQTLTGIVNDEPRVRPDVLSPNTSPSVLTSGPPETPG